jgi:hypothetical protein
VSRFFLLAASAGLAAVPALAQEVVIYDSQGFESFTLGGLNGQSGWLGYVDQPNPPNPGNLGVLPQVVDASGGNQVLGARSVRLEIPDQQSAASAMERLIPDLVAAGYRRVTVTYDIYRPADLWASNLWWWWVDSGEPTYGLIWDEAVAANAGVYPFGWVQSTPHMPVAFNQWKTLVQTWNFDTNQATATYGGVAFAGAVNISGITSLTGWDIFLEHTEATGSGPDVVWIDNFKITAVGAACYANCDSSTAAPVLNVADFTCFLNKYAAGDAYANCDGSTTSPVLNVADFTCFLNKFAAGCQ